MHLKSIWDLCIRVLTRRIQLCGNPSLIRHFFLFFLNKSQRNRNGASITPLVNATWGELFIHGLGSILALNSLDLATFFVCDCCLMTNSADVFTVPQCSTLGARFLFIHFHVNELLAFHRLFLHSFFTYLYSHPDFQDYLQLVCMYVINNSV